MLKFCVTIRIYLVLRRSGVANKFSSRFSGRCKVDLLVYNLLLVFRLHVPL
jgi:hypothetical protein